MADRERPIEMRDDDAATPIPVFDADSVVDEFVNLAEWLRDREAAGWAR
ncbi:MAG: hypothetical protein ACFCUS_08620 [Rubrimonas sp.]